MTEFVIFWKDGTTTNVRGKNIADACNRFGIGGGAINVMDFYDRKENIDKWRWDVVNRNWVLNTQR